jgi:protein-S-isoprenylcysteine O-methyltransferase Ste14
MKKTISLLYGVISYLAFLGSVLYAIGFTANVVVPKTIDSTPGMKLPAAIAIDAALLLLFALQHSIMARPAFKRAWTRIVPVHLERSTYVLLSSLCLILLMWQWQPIGGLIWSTDNEVVKGILFALAMMGWGIVFVSTFLINHFDLFGLRQVWFHFQGKAYAQLPFRIPALYRVVRHPLYFGFLVAFWATPVMTVAHLVFAVLTTGYILTAIQLEEKDLVDEFGLTYSDYKKEVPMILPFRKRKKTNGNV